MATAPQHPHPQQTGVPHTPQPNATDLEAVEQLSRAYKVMAAELGKVIVGQEEVVEQVLTAMFCQGHVLLVGVPGLAKTLLVRTISDVLHLSFKRDPVHAGPDAVATSPARTCWRRTTRPASGRSGS